MIAKQKCHRKHVLTLINRKLKVEQMIRKSMQTCPIKKMKAELIQCIDSLRCKFDSIFVVVLILKKSNGIKLMIVKHNYL